MSKKLQFSKYILLNNFKKLTNIIAPFFIEKI